MDCDPTLCRAFVAEAKRLFGEHPEIAHTWSIDADEDHCVLDIPKASDDGFDIVVEADPCGITLTCEALRASEAIVAETPEDFAGHCVGLLYDLLSPLMRVRERLAGESAYKWTLECLRGDIWEERASRSLFFFNYWAKRTERIYRNTVLPLRSDALLSP